MIAVSGMSLSTDETARLAEVTGVDEGARLDSAVGYSVPRSSKTPGGCVVVSADVGAPRPLGLRRDGPSGSFVAASALVFGTSFPGGASAPATFVLASVRVCVFFGEVGYLDLGCLCLVYQVGDLGESAVHDVFEHVKHHFVRDVFSFTDIAGAEEDPANKKF